jgi:hypothetical protein
MNELVEEWAKLQKNEHGLKLLERAREEYERPRDELKRKLDEEDRQYAARKAAR